MRFVFVLTATVLLLYCGSSSLIAQDSPKKRLLTSNDTDMIVGGREANQGSWPWQVRLYENASDTEGFCGGTLIADDWVLTAAHCMFNADGSKKDEVVVGYGHVDRTKTIKLRSSSIHPHQDYDGSSHDIALISLRKSISLPGIWIGVADSSFER